MRKVAANGYREQKEYREGDFFVSQRVKFVPFSADEKSMEGVLQNRVTSAKSDIAGVLFAILLFLFSGYQLFYFSGESQVPPDAVQIGTLKTEGSIRRRHARTLHWGNVAHSGNVYVGDIIYTPKDTTAVVSWGKNETLGLEPDSMVQFDEITLDSVSIVLMEGKVKQSPAGAKKQRIVVSVKEKEPDVFRVMPYPQTSTIERIFFEFASLENDKQVLDARLREILAQKTIIEKFVKLAATPDFNPEPSDFRILLNSEPQEKYNKGKDGWVTMSWKKMPIKDVVYQLEISREKNFERYLSHRTKNNELSIQFDDLGRYFWRVKAIQGSLESTSEVKQFTIGDGSQPRDVTSDAPASPVIK